MNCLLELCECAVHGLRSLLWWSGHLRQNSKILRILTAGEKGKARISRPIKSAGMALIKNVLREPYVVGALCSWVDHPYKK